VRQRTVSAAPIGYHLGIRLGFASAGKFATSVATLLAGLVCIGCSTLPDVPRGVCGNHVVENDEDCDSSSPKCGAPSSGASACRFVCDPTHAIDCPGGYFCGRDQICRKPKASGSYTLGPPIAIAGARLQVVDLDGDRVPDVVERTVTALNLLRNDGTGKFTQLAAGIPRGEFAGSMPARVAAAPATATSGPLLAVGTQRSTSLFTWKDGNVDPLIVPSTLLPQARSQRRLVGAAAPGPYGLPLVVVLDDDRLSAFPLAWGRTVAELSGVDLASSCPPPILETKMRTDALGVTTIVLLGAHACVGGFDAKGNLQLHMLGDYQFNTYDGKPFDRSLLLDVDGNGMLDLLSASNNPADDANVVWLQTASGFLPSVMVPQAINEGHEVRGTADFNGDGREDIVQRGELLLNLTTGKESTFDPGGGFEFQASPPEAIGGINTIAGDFNGDHHADLISWGDPNAYWDFRSQGFVTCFGDGSGSRFTCATVLAPLNFDRAASGDINGDSIPDVALLGGAMGVELGRYLTTPLSVTPLPQPVTGTTIGDIAFAPSPSEVAAQLAVLVNDQSGAQAIASTTADVNGQLEFGYPGAPTVDPALADFNGDGKPDLAMMGVGQDGGHVRVYSAGLPFDVSNTVFPFRSVEFGTAPEFWPVDAQQPPWIAGVTAKASVVGKWNGHSYDVVTIPWSFNVTQAYQRVIDLDGDGRLEMVQLGLAEGIKVIRVLHIDATGAPQAFDSPPHPPVGVWILVDLPPFDGRLDLVEYSGLPMQTHYFVQRSDFTFEERNDRTLTVLDEQGKPFDVVTSLASGQGWRTTADFNGDGLADLLIVGTDGAAHIAFADVDDGQRRPGSGSVGLSR
jgi:hypothetical protein